MGKIPVGISSVFGSVGMAQVGKNAYLVESLDAYFPDKRETFNRKELKQLESQVRAEGLLVVVSHTFRGCYFKLIILPDT